MRCKFVAVCLFTLALGCARPIYVKSSDDSLSSGQRKSAQPEQSFSTKLHDQTKGIYWNWEIKPTETTPGSFLFRIYTTSSLDGFPTLVNIAIDPSVVLWMPEMGHGSTPVQITKIDTATYRASNVFFIMPGKWQIKFQFKEGEAVLDEAVVDLTL